MAKKQKSFSHVFATEALEQLSNRGTTSKEFIHELLRIFAGYGDGQIERIRDGRGNLSKDEKTVLIKNLVAYRSLETTSEGEGSKKLYEALKSMTADIKITKQSPRLYIASDGTVVIAYDPKEKDYYENSISLLWKDFEFFTPLAGIEKIQYTEEAEADVKSAELMAKLFDDIRRYNDIRDKETVHALNIFMSRLLFCFFAEDTSLFPGKNLFTSLIASYTKEDGSDLSEFIDRAFIAMSTKDPEVLSNLPLPFDRFPYVNGGLFKDRYPIPKLSRRARTLILNCGEYDWKDINPDIFGSMIQAVVTPEQRAGLGMHYTSVPNIEKLIRPLFLDALEEEFEAACVEAREKVERIKKQAKGEKIMSFQRAVQRLNDLLGRLSKIKFFDPACGSGNFLIISYKMVRDLEIRIWKAIREIGNVAVLPIPNISLTQFYGIEIDEFARDTAILSLWLAEHQMNVKFREAFGVQPDSLPLKPSGQIVCGNACRLDWNTVCPHTPDDEIYIMGNPPYLGSSMQNKEQKKDLELVCGHFHSYRNLDYIASWFFKATSYISNTPSKAAFVTTNSIAQGEQVALLWPNVFNNGVEISFVHTSFKWNNNAKYNAAVSVNIIGLKARCISSIKYIINGRVKTKVDNINPYLSCGENIVVPRISIPIAHVPEMIRGSMPSDGGGLILSFDEYTRLAAVTPENIYPLKKYMGADDFLNDYKRFCIWANEEEYKILDLIPAFHERFEIVRKSRLASDTASTAEYAQFPYLFRQPQYKPTDAIIVPGVSSERRRYIPMGFVDKDTVISNAAFAIYDADLSLFALMNSYLHNLWVKKVGGTLENRIRYANTLCYNTFPFPKLTTAEQEELSQSAKDILNIRDENFEMTLGEMYNPESMPEELREAHHQLDLAVERIYRAEPFKSDEERLEHLFKLYAKMTKK